MSTRNRDDTIKPLSRVGFFAQWQARYGLLPAQVSPMSLLKARRYRLTAWIGAPVLIAFALAVIVLSVGSSTSDRAAVVRDVSHIAGESSAPGQLEIALEDGRIVFLDRDPQVHAGETVLVRTTSNGAAVGLVVRGEFVRTSYTYESGWWPVVFGAIYVALAMLIIGPVFVWGRRAYRQIKDDIEAPLATARGRYLGSWTWGGLTSRLGRSLRPRRLAWISGFPVAIEERPGDITWFAAPVQLLPDVRRFEQAMANGDREVVVAFHPHTRAIAKLETADGAASLDVQPLLDRLPPERGGRLRMMLGRRDSGVSNF